MAKKEKKLTATQKWALKNKKNKRKAKPSDLGSGGAGKAASALARRKALLDGYTFK